MNNKFDELTKGLAQSVTRRGALKKFGLGLAGVVLASLGLAARAHPCDCSVQYFGCRPSDIKCVKNCAYRCS